MNLSLKYGSGTVSARLPENWRVEKMEPPAIAPLEDPVKELEHYLQEPSGAEPFDRHFAGKKSVCIIVPDKTRKAGVAALLPHVLGRFVGLGLGPDRVDIIFATGIHPGQTEAEQRGIVGDAVFDSYRCRDHDCHAEDLVEAGKLGGRPFMLNRIAATADSILVMGGVKHHYQAGFGGARKAVMPGISSYQNCLDFHKLCLDPDGPGRHPSVGPEVLEGNPMHRRAMEAAHMAGAEFFINTVVGPDGNILFVNAGGMERSFLEACGYAGRSVRVKASRPADVVIASCGGYPSDINLVQAHKSLDSASRAVKPGGVVILLAECRDGVGNRDLQEWLKLPSILDMDRKLREEFAINGQTAMAFREKTKRARVFLVSSLPRETAEQAGCIPAADFQEAADLAAQEPGDRPSVLVMPDASGIHPQV